MKKSGRFVAWKPAWNEAQQLQAMLLAPLPGGFDICGWSFNHRDVEVVGLHRHPAGNVPGLQPLITLQIRFKSGLELLFERSHEDGYAAWRLPLSGPGSFTYVRRTS
jgi:hypothetical protein